MRTHREVFEMFQEEYAQTEMLANCVKHIVHCFLEPNVNEGNTSQEVMGISVDKESDA
jgi:hypothetical protein